MVVGIGRSWLKDESFGGVCLGLWESCKTEAEPEVEEVRNCSFANLLLTQQAFGQDAQVHKVRLTR